MSPRTKSERIAAWTALIGGYLLAPLERLIVNYSLVENASYLPLECFPWTARLQNNWLAIRAELEQVLEDVETLPNASEYQVDVSAEDYWKAFLVYGAGFEAQVGAKMCRQTAMLVQEVPGVTMAMFSILSPHKHITAHRGFYKGLLRYHLALIVPRDQQACKMRVGDTTHQWEEGRGVIFDETVDHEVWNDSDEMRVVLLIDVLRPLPEPVATINRVIVKAIGLSPPVQRAMRNQRAWERRFLERHAARCPGTAV